MALAENGGNPLEHLDTQQQITPETTQEIVSQGKNIAQGLGGEVQEKYAGTRQETLQGVKESQNTTIDKKEALKGDMEFLNIVTEKFKDIEIDSEILGGMTQEEAWKSFVEFLSHLQPQEQEQLKTLFQDSDMERKIQRYIKRNGYLNTQTYIDFTSEFDIVNTQDLDEGTQDLDEGTQDLDEGTQDLDEGTQDLGKDTEQKNKKTKAIYESQLDNLGKLSGSPEAAHIIGLIQGLENFSDLETDLKAIQEAFGEGPDSNLWKILEAFKKLDAENAAKGQKTEYYNTFSTQLASSSPEMAAQVRTFAANFAVTHPSETPENTDTARVRPGLPPGVQPTISGNTLSAPDGQGNTITMDVSTEPPRRFIATEGSNYQLETDMPVDTMYGPTVKYENAKNALTPKIDTLTQIIDYVGTLTDTTPVSEAISSIVSGLSYTFKTNNPEIVTAIQSATSIQELQSIASTGILFAKKVELEKELSEAETQYKQDLADAQASYRERMETRDEKVKKTLQFLTSIGFTDIPQSLTDTIISQINQSQELRQAIGINTDGINLTEGELGFEDSGAGEGVDDINNRINFAKLINKMIGVQDEKGEAINIAALQNGSGAPVGDKMRFTKLLSESGLLNVGGAATAITNLKKQEQ